MDKIENVPMKGKPLYPGDYWSTLKQVETFGLPGSGGSDVTEGDNVVPESINDSVESDEEDEPENEEHTKVSKQPIDKALTFLLKRNAEY